MNIDELRQLKNGDKVLVEMIIKENLHDLEDIDYNIYVAETNDEDDIGYSVSGRSLICKYPIIDKNTGLQFLSGEFNRGYTKAIQDVIEIFNYIQPDLKHHHKNLNGKLSVELLNCILENRGQLRDSVFGLPNQGFIRYNGKLNKFEYYKPDSK